MTAAHAARWLAAHAPPFESTGPRRLSPFEQIDPDDEAEDIARTRAWQRHKHDHGWSGLSVPESLGGRGRSRADDLEFIEEESRFRLPTHALEVTTRMVLPTLVQWAPSRSDLIERILRGDDLWCQLFSEPGVGSDLASLSTRAEQQADGSWQVTGQKVWTSWAHHAQRGYLLARTGAEAHAGVTAFVVDMTSPGVTVRPIRQATGSATFAEVFFDGARVPVDAVIGEPGQGWDVARTTLMNERLAVGPDQIPYAEIHALAAQLGRLDDPVIAARVGDLRARTVVLAQLRRRMLLAVRRGDDPGPEGSAAKLVLAASARAAADLARALRGADLLHDDRWSQLALAWLGFANAGGTDEIQKSIIADRVLRLPREATTGTRA